MNKKHLYVGYGSNMNENLMERRRPGSVDKGAVLIKNFMLTLPHWADIENCFNEATPGRLWEVNDEQLADLDIQEGVDKNEYMRATVSVVDSKGNTHTAIAYVMTKEFKEIKVDELLVSEGYVGRIIEGYKQVGFSEADWQPFPSREEGYSKKLLARFVTPTKKEISKQLKPSIFS